MEKIAAECKPEQREPWLRQMADSLSTAAQNSPAGDRAAMKRLVQLEESMVKAAPGSNLAAYVTYREMQADYAVRITKEEYAAAQKEWVDRLTKFVETYSKAEDTPDALLAAGHGQRVPEQGSGGEELVRRAGEELRRHAAGQEGGRLHRPAGAGRQAVQAGRPDADDSNTIYNIEQSAGKVVVVYYWASWISQSAADFAKLKALADAEGKGVEIVCVNLDGTPKEAHDFLATAPPVGVHLYQSGGMESKLATDYGITVLPNLIVVGKDGKVVNRNVQINTLDDEVKKQLQK